MLGVRFAPSPTGVFHFGNLRTAWISALWARSLGEPWVVRFEDIDRPRVVPGAQEKQLRDMAALGLVPDEVRVQSAAHSRHEALLRLAVERGQVYPCFCSRKEVQAALAGAASAPHSGDAAYSGACRGREDYPRVAHPTIAWRFKGEDPSGSGDFIVARSASIASRGEPIRDFVPSYHWACAIDDDDGDYRLLVRASDLFEAHGIQQSIRNWLAKVEGRAPRRPAVFHTALLTRNDGHRLEKRTAGVTIDEWVQAGYRVEQILKNFEQSFDRTLLKRVPAPGESIGEKNSTLALEAIGF